MRLDKSLKLTTFTLLQKISIDIQRPVKDSENIDVAIGLYQIGDSIVAVEKNADGARGFSFVLVSSFGMPF